MVTSANSKPGRPSAVGEIPLDLVAQIQEAERRRVSRELHDRSAHALAVALQCLELHRHDTAAGLSDRAARRLAAAERSIRDALDAILGIIRELRRVVDGSDLVAALDDYLQLAAPAGVGVDVVATGSFKELPDALADQTFLILREAVHNALRHAEPRHLTIELTAQGSELTARITDDGIGFDEEVTAHQGSGLLSMAERAELIGARFRVTSSSAGTLVDLRVPLPSTES